MTFQNPLLPAPVEDLNVILPAPATGLTNDDLARLRRSLDSSLSDNTRAVYNSAWKTFESCAQANVALTLPTSPPLAAVKATAKSKRPLGGPGKRRSERPGGPGWTWPCWPPCGPG